MHLEHFETLQKIIMEGRWKIDVEAGTVIKSRGKQATSIESHGYFQIMTTYQRKDYRFYLHQIIAVAAGLNPVGKTINHIDGNKRNNRIENLEVVTLSENVKHAHSTGLHAVGENMANAKLSSDAVYTIRKMYADGVQQKKLAEMFNVCSGTVHCIVKRKRWKHI